MQHAISRPGSLVMTATTTSPPFPPVRQATRIEAGAGETGSPPQVQVKRKGAPGSDPTAASLASKRHCGQSGQSGKRVRVISHSLFSAITPPPTRRQASSAPLTQPGPDRHSSRWQAGMAAIPITLPQISEEELEPGSPPNAHQASLTASLTAAPAVEGSPRPRSPAMRFPAAPPAYPRPLAQPVPSLQPSPPAHVAFEVPPSPAASASMRAPAPAPQSPGAARPWRTTLSALDPQRMRELEQLARQRDYGGRGRDPLEALDALYRALWLHGSTDFVTNATRTLSTMEYLVDRGVRASELPGLLSSGRLRDLARTVPNALLTYGASFLLAAGVTTLLEPEAAGLTSDPLAPCPEAGTLPPWLGASLLHLLGDLIIGVGAEWSTAVWREGGLDQGYTRPEDVHRGEDGQPLAFAQTSVGRRVQALSALPFAVLYIAHRLFPEFMGPPLARLGWGAAAATTSGLWREGMGQALAWESNPVWLDGSDGRRQDRMRAALRELRSPTSALGQGAQALWTGLIRATGRPDAAATVRALMRTAMALVARVGSLVAASLGRQHDPLWASAADAWLGLSWGYLSTLPARGTQLLARGLVSSLPARPAKGDQAAAPRAVAPALALPPAPGVLTPR